MLGEVGILKSKLKELETPKKEEKQDRAEQKAPENQEGEDRCWCCSSLLFVGPPVHALPTGKMICDACSSLADNMGGDHESALKTIRASESFQKQDRAKHDSFNSLNAKQENSLKLASERSRILGEIVQTNYECHSSKLNELFGWVEDIMLELKDWEPVDEARQLTNQEIIMEQQQFLMNEFSEMKKLLSPSQTDAPLLNDMQAAIDSGMSMKIEVSRTKSLKGKGKGAMLVWGTAFLLGLVGLSFSASAQKPASYHLSFLP
jgi:hypothetical protein